MILPMQGTYLATYRKWLNQNVMREIHTEVSEEFEFEFRKKSIESAFFDHFGTSGFHCAKSKTLNMNFFH